MAVTPENRMLDAIMQMLTQLQGDVVSLSTRVGELEARQTQQPDHDGEQHTVNDLAVALTQVSSQLSALQVATQLAQGSYVPMQMGLQALKGWTQKQNATIIFDSSYDPFVFNVFHERVMNVQDVAVVGFTSEGCVFGGFFHRPVGVVNVQVEDPHVFAFSFASRGACETPQQFVPPDVLQAVSPPGVRLMTNDSGFIRFSVGGVQGFSLGNQQSKTSSSECSIGFRGMNDEILSGKPGKSKYTCVRLVALRLF